MKYSFEIGMMILAMGAGLYLWRIKKFLILPNRKFAKALWYEIVIVLIGWLFIFFGLMN